MTTIEVICAEHDETFVVQLFSNDHPGDPGSFWYADGADPDDPNPFKGADSGVELLMDDKYVGNRRKRHPSLMGQPGFRIRYTLQCGICGDVVLSRDEKLQPVLDVLEANKISTITLRGLRGIVAS